MLLKDYYTIENVTNEQDKILFAVRLNPDAEVYRGHFPGKPISPGVCNIRMIMECASQVAGFDAVINNVKRCRFLKPVVPDVREKYCIEIRLASKTSSSVLEAVLRDGTTIYLDFEGDIKKRG